MAPVRREDGSAAGAQGKPLAADAEGNWAFDIPTGDALRHGQPTRVSTNGPSKEVCARSVVKQFQSAKARSSFAPEGASPAPNADLCPPPSLRKRSSTLRRPGPREAGASWLKPSINPEISRRPSCEHRLETLWAQSLRRNPGELIIHCNLAESPPHRIDPATIWPRPMPSRPLAWRLACLLNHDFRGGEQLPARACACGSIVGSELHRPCSISYVACLRHPWLNLVGGGRPEQSRSGLQGAGSGVY